MAYLYYTWKTMNTKINNQLNIRTELAIATLSWTITDYVYILFSLIDFNNNYNLIFYSQFFVILLRNIATFIATTFWTLRLVHKNDTTYYTDQRISFKSSILNLDVIMTHSLTFNYFKNFIHEKKQSYIVYLNLYMLIELYKKKLNVLY